MVDFNYQEYIALFNTGDDEKLCRTYFTEDAVMQTATQLIESRENLLKFLNFAHDGVREILHPQVVLADKNNLITEINIEFVASKDKPEFVFKPLTAGESITVKFFAAYKLRDGKVCYLKTAHWPVNYGV